MKKILGMVVVVAMVAMFVIPAFAADNSDSSTNNWFQQMFDYRKARVDQAVKDGQLTEEQGKAYKEQFDQMYKFQENNGFVCPMGGPGFGYGMGYGNGAGYGMGYGQNMMNGYGY